MDQERQTIHERAKDTGLALVLILLLAAQLIPHPTLVWPAIALLVITMTWPKMFRPLAVVWFGLSHLLGQAASKIILSLLFIAVVAPMGFVRKLAGRDPMQLKAWQAGGPSFFNERKHVFTKSDLEKPY